MATDWENYGRKRTHTRQSSGYHTHSYVDGNTVRKERTDTGEAGAKTVSRTEACPHTRN